MHHPHTKLCVILLVGMAFLLQQTGVKASSSFSIASTSSSSRNVTYTQETRIFSDKISSPAITAVSLVDVSPSSSFVIIKFNSTTVSVLLEATGSNSRYSIPATSLLQFKSTVTSILSTPNLTTLSASLAPISSQITPSSASRVTSTPNSGSPATTMSTVSHGSIGASLSVVLASTESTLRQNPAVSTSPSAEVSPSTAASQDWSYSTTVDERNASPIITSTKTTSLSSENAIEPPTSRFSTTVQPLVSTTPSPMPSPSTAAGSSAGDSSTAETGPKTTKIRQVTKSPLLSSPGLISLSVQGSAVSNRVAKTTAVNQSSIVESITALSSSKITASKQSQSINSSTTYNSSSVNSTISRRPTTDFNITTMPLTKQPITTNCWGGGCGSANRLNNFVYLVISSLIVSCFCVILTQ